MKLIAGIFGISMLCLFLSCSRTPTEEWKASFAEIDNSTPDTIRLLIDGQDQGIVAPYAIVRKEISPRNHSYRIMKGTEELDRIEATGEKGKVTVINPKGLSAYEVISANYGRTTIGTGEAVADAGSPKAINSDFGLLKNLPRSVTIEQLRIMGIPASGTGSDVTRNKLMKKTFGEITPSRAIAMIAGHRAYYQNDLVNAFKVLATASKSEEIRNALIACLDSSDRQLLVAKAYLSLANYEAEIPEGKLCEWFSRSPDSQKDEHYEGDASYTEQGSVGTERIKAGARIASRRNDGVLIRDHFAKLPEAQQLILYEGLTVNIPDKKEISPSLLTFLVSEAMKSFGDKQKIYHEIERDDFVIDDAFMKQMEDLIAAQKEPNTIRFWNSIWWRKLAKFAQTHKDFPSSGTLVEIIRKSRTDRSSSQYPDAIIDEATKALAERGDTGKR